MKKVILFFGSAIIFGLVVGLLLPKNTEPTGTSDTSSASIILPPTSSQVEAEINKFRASKGLALFDIEVPALDQAAQARAEQMCSNNDWSHDKAWQSLDPYYAYSYSGENLYYGYLQKNQAANSVRDWVASPSHLANLVGNYSQIGIGVKSCPGFQNESTAVIITNYFGVPR